MDNKIMDIDLQIAPMQGFTQAPWRRFRREVYGGVWHEYTPFLRVERGEVRARDLRDFTSPLNEGSHLTPQVIFRDVAELATLCDTLAENGATRIDLNCGCPHPPQVNHGRGAALVGNPDMMRRICEFIKRRPEIEFSLKMRLGTERPDEWRGVIDIINAMPLVHVTVHPRTARQLYRGELHMEEFGRLLSSCERPVVFNGEIRTPGDIEEVSARYPSVMGVMIGRGLCARPSLLTEVAQGREWSEEERMIKLKEFHDRLLDYYRNCLCGDTQILQHIKNFWAYSESVIGRRLWKSINKATTLSRYLSALSSIYIDIIHLH